jgi:cell division protein ZapA (FtsZ GTPase activity inhibitor)
MAIVEIMVRKTKYKIECEASEKERLLRLADSLNKRVTNIAGSMGNTDEKTILIISSLILEAELEDKNSVEIIDKKLETSVITQNASEEDIHNALSDNIKNITQHIDKLANKILNY